MLPKTPSQMSPYAKACLESLAQQGLGQFLSIGGAFGLSYFVEYRSTHDVDAWWIEPLTQEQRREVIRTLQQALTNFGNTRLREWGDVVSVELLQEGKVIFSFQIAKRSAQLTDPIAAPWPGGARLDSLIELIASKMVALVERGAPRDFRDIYQLCHQGLTNVRQCWELWQTRQQLANENADIERAKLAIRTHLARIERSRPLESISDPNQRQQAAQVRQWYREEFLGND
jgi:predicted nucleotidyltransferase component of viral defense system